MLNGGLADAAQSVGAAAAEFGGVMLAVRPGTPRVLSEVSLQLWPSVRLPSDAQVVDAMMAYAARQVAQGVPLRVMTRPMLGLVSSQTGARWRRMLSDPTLLAANNPSLIYDAWRTQTQAPEPPRRDARSRPGRHLNDAPATNKTPQAQAAWGVCSARQPLKKKATSQTGNPPLIQAARSRLRRSVAAPPEGKCAASGWTTFRPSSGQSRIYAWSMLFSNFCAATMACPCHRKRSRPSA